MADLALPAALATPAWLNPVSNAGQLPLPEALHRALNSAAHRERWKYTKAEAFLGATHAAANLPLINGARQPGIEVKQTAAPTPLVGFDLEQAPEAFARLCYASNILTIDVSAPTTEPLTLAHAANTVPILIRVAQHASLTLNEISDCGSDAQQTTWIDLAANAELRHSRNSLDTAGAHWQYLNVRLQRDSSYRLHNHVTGCRSRRQDVHIIMDGQGAEANLMSAGSVEGKSALDQQFTLEHRQPRGRSQQTIHNIVANGGKCTFNGRIHIHEGAAGTDAQLANKNLGMGEHATINSKPELEIYTDDVRCAHGATVGTISQDALFYLLSRGIDQNAAQALLSQGFLRQCIDGPLAESALETLIGGAFVDL
ncbi:MAG: hypothetical protein GWP70_05975 [Proteobacteria bacterium]|nr:hypothetical protein [Pseudomonadota bacterium]